MHIRILTQCSKLEIHKALNKGLNKKLMPVAWHPKRWCDWCLSEDEKKERELTFTDKVGKQ